MSLTETERTRFLTALKTGATISAAARFARLEVKTVMGWRVQAKAGTARPEIMQLYADMEEARATPTIAVLGNVAKASGEDWRAGVAWLKLTDPKRYDRQTVDVNANVQAGLVVPPELQRLSDEELRDVIAQGRAVRALPAVKTGGNGGNGSGGNGQRGGAE